jgi:ubiquinone/menaquinone biosynthesis C-methylase UbiE
MQQVDYDVQQYQNYARGRALPLSQLTTWIDAFAAQLPDRRPLRGLDLGCGTGRFTPALAEAFGPVTGVEPAAKMRETAETEAARAGVDYVPGSAESIPLPTGSVDYILMFLVWHHVADKARAAREMARVAAPGATLLLRAQFRDHMPRLWWLEHFPRGHEADASMYESLAEVTAWFEQAGWAVSELTAVEEVASRTYSEVLERLRLRPYSTFEQLTEDEIRIGFERLEQAVTATPDATTPPTAASLLVLTRL